MLICSGQPGIQSITIIATVVLNLLSSFKTRVAIIVMGQMLFLEYLCMQWLQSTLKALKWYLSRQNSKLHFQNLFWNQSCGVIAFNSWLCLSKTTYWAHIRINCIASAKRIRQNRYLPDWTLLTQTFKIMNRSSSNARLVLYLCSGHCLFNFSTDN